MSKTGNRLDVLTHRKILFLRKVEWDDLQNVTQDNGDIGINGKIQFAVLAWSQCSRNAVLNQTEKPSTPSIIRVQNSTRCEKLLKVDNGRRNCLAAKRTHFDCHELASVERILVCFPELSEFASPHGIYVPTVKHMIRWKGTIAAAECNLQSRIATNAAETIVIDLSPTNLITDLSDGFPISWLKTFSRCISYPRRVTETRSYSLVSCTTSLNDRISKAGAVYSGEGQEEGAKFDVIAVGQLRPYIIQNRPIFWCRARETFEKKDVSYTMYSSRTKCL